MMARSTKTLQSKAGYIDARPHIPQLEEVLLQRTAGPYICVKSGLLHRSKSTAPLPSSMLINCIQTELDATGRRSRLGTWPTRNGLMPAGQVGELWSDFY